MAYDDQYRLGAHAVFTDELNNVLLLKATYDKKIWGLPGGAVDPGETIHETLIRECKEELGVEIKILYMSGIYFHKVQNVHVCIFRCEMSKNSILKLSDEHSEYKYFPVSELSDVQRHRVIDCLDYDGTVKSAKF